MKPDSKILDDVAKLAGGAIGIANDLRQSVGDNVKERLEVVATDLDLVARDDFERLEQLVKQQQLEIDALKKDILSLKKASKSSK